MTDTDLTGKTIFEKGAEGRRSYSLPEIDVPYDGVDELIPPELRRKTPPRLPQVDEVTLVRHYIALSVLNHHIDKGMYPLGSCTMKYNPKINEALAARPGFTRVHPLAPETASQGALAVMHQLGELLKEIVGMDAVTLQPSAGAQGELTGLMMIRAAQTAAGDPRRYVVIPDSAHGTNPASVTMAGYGVRQVASDTRGLIDLVALEKLLDEDVAALMLTNPNTLGLFERDICEIEKLVHSKGALLYLDGANLNAILGITRPGDMGFDVVHINLHKSFSTPHGGGGPGSGPIAVKAGLEPYLPAPVLAEKDGLYFLDRDRPDSIGRIHSFYGNFNIMVRALVYIRRLGPEGLRQVSEAAIINANYLARALAEDYDLTYAEPPLHELVLSAASLKEHGVRAGDVAKRLLDYGFHSPTVYFPLIVPEALMVEPTETESRETLDAFIAAMKAIAREAARDPDTVTSAPHTTPVRRLDEARAARYGKLSYYEELKTPPTPEPGGGEATGG
jgi:glycine dehydrogenase subunit 2